MIYETSFDDDVQSENFYLFDKNKTNTNGKVSDSLIQIQPRGKAFLSGYETKVKERMDEGLDVSNLYKYS